ncbi:MAG: hypothetical protein M3313_08745 [Actinomycetota bacterium]|nr:hypothetical protein [Actinomycetota bacterium]
MSEQHDEDLIESVQRPRSAWQRRVDRLLRRPAMPAALLVVGLIAGSGSGYLVGQSNPRMLAGLGYFFLPAEGGEGLDPFEVPSSDPDYGRAPLPILTADDLAAIGEDVVGELTIVSARSTIPVLCDTSIGQPGGPTFMDVRYPSTVFRVGDGQFTELIWPHADPLAAARTLHTLVFQAQLCPDVHNSETAVRTTGVLNGIGDEYVLFFREPTTSGPDTFFATVALVRLGADLIEVSFVPEIIDIPDAEARCRRVAEAAVERASGG